MYCVYEGDKSQMGACYSRAVKLIRLVLTGGTVVPSGQAPHHAYVGAPGMPAYGGAAAGATQLGSYGADPAFASNAVCRVGFRPFRAQGLGG